MLARCHYSHSAPSVPLPRSPAEQSISARRAQDFYARPQRKQRGVKSTIPQTPGTWPDMGAMAGPLGARGVRNAPRTFWAPTSGNGRASGNAKTAHFSGNGHSAPENAPAHTAAIPGHRAHCPRAKRAQIFPQTPRGWVLARASVPAQKVRVACAELSATKTIEQ